MIKQTETVYVLPTWIAPALYYGDVSHLSDLEASAVQLFEEQANREARQIAADEGRPFKGLCWSTPEPVGFGLFNDLPGVLGRAGADCVEITMVVTMQGGES